MHFTPYSFVQTLREHHDITRDDISQTCIVQALVKKYWDRILTHTILQKITLDETLVTYIKTLKKAWLLQPWTLNQLVRHMKAASGITHTDVVSYTPELSVSQESEWYEYHHANDTWVMATCNNTIYKRTITTDLKKML